MKRKVESVRRVLRIPGSGFWKKSGKSRYPGISPDPAGAWSCYTWWCLSTQGARSRTQRSEQRPSCCQRCDPSQTFSRTWRVVSRLTKIDNLPMRRKIVEGAKPMRSNPNEVHNQTQGNEANNAIFMKSKNKQLDGINQSILSPHLQPSKHNPASCSTWKLMIGIKAITLSKQSMHQGIRHWSIRCP